MAASLKERLTPLKGHLRAFYSHFKTPKLGT